MLNCDCVGAGPMSGGSPIPEAGGGTPAASSSVSHPSASAGMTSGGPTFGRLAVRSRVWITSLGFLFLLGMPLGASASPIQYAVTGGSVQIMVMVGASVVGTTTSPGLSGTITLDPVAHSLNSLDLNLDPNIALVLSSAYGGYDSIMIESASLTGDAGFGPLGVPQVNPASYTASAGPLTVNGFWSATDSFGVNPPAPSTSIAYAVNTVTAVVNTSPLVTISGVTLNSLSGASFSEPSDLTVLASFFVTSVTVIPEPGTALLTGFGLALMAATRRHARSRA